MSVFILDGKPGRKWNELAPGSLLLRVMGKRMASSPQPQVGDVVLFHHEQGGDLRWLAESLASQGVLVVAVNQGGGTGSELGSGFYERRKGVGSPVDPHFTSCFSHFLKRLNETGRPDWTLLEGPPAPDALLAYHLLGLLSDDTEAAAARQGLVGAALEEGRVIAEANRRKRPTEAEIRDHDYLRELLRL